jgi:hypothetical protein
MPFAEPRPHRRPFFAQGQGELTVAPSSARISLAVTSFTVANQDVNAHFARLTSASRTGQTLIMEVLVPGESTLHLPFPHPIMIGAGDTFFAIDEAPNGALFPMTVVGYEWLASDDEATPIRRTFPWFSYRLRETAER